jgi:hypothetical protein
MTKESTKIARHTIILRKLLLKDKMNTEPANKLRKKDTAMEGFLSQFYAEWEERNKMAVFSILVFSFDV